MGIEAARKVMPNVPHAIVMDTAWHQTMGEEAFMYAIPYSWYTDFNIRRYGFHGTSHLYCAKRAAVLLGKENKDTNVIICHIGNGASICAVKNGVCIDTSMGLTPLEGLIMGTRCGDIDPAIVTFMMNKTNMSATEMDATLNKKSGLLGICGLTDRRDVHDQAGDGNKKAQLAIKMETHRIKKYIGSYTALLGRVDAIVFTAGVGEMGEHIRLQSLEGLKSLGIDVDAEKNNKCRCRNGEFDVSKDSSPSRIYIIPTDEELVMTEDAHALMDDTYDIHTKFTYSFEDPNYVNKARARALVKNIQKKPFLKTILVKAPNAK
jgi:acetate kinase